MTEIPNDVLVRATAAVDDAREDFLLAKVSDNQHNLRKVAVDVLSRAILSERHRCAVIARNWQPSSFQDEHYAANSIADRIMAGEK